MSDISDFFARLSGLLRKDSRYKEEVYLFVMAALGRAVQSLKAPRHVTGAELLQSIRLEGEQQFGPMTATVFEHWGVKNSLDFGHIVFNMVREGILSKTETDSVEDFKDASFFENLFDSASGYRLIESKEGSGQLSKIKLKTDGVS